MSNVPDIPRPQARKFPVLGCIAVPFVLIAVIICAGIWSGLHYVDGVNARIAELEAGIRERGQPLTLDELNAYYLAVPDEENAALVYGEAFELMDAIDPGREREAGLWDRLMNLGKGAEIPPELLDEMQKYLAECSEVSEVLGRAARIPRARYPVDFLQGFESDLPHLSKLRSCARLEVMHGTMAAFDRDFAEYVASQGFILHMASTLSAEPALVSQLVRQLLHSMAAEAMVRDLNRAPLPRDSLRELALLYSDRECPECLSRAIAGEWCMWTTALRTTFAEANASRDVEVEFMDTVMEKTGGAAVFRHLTNLRYLEILRLLEPLTIAENASWPERLKVADDMAVAAEEAVLLNLTAQVLLPSIRGAVIALAREAAVLRMAQVVLAVEQYRDATGTLPESLEQLVPEYLSEVPIDPFDGQLLRYKRGVAGYKVYSVYFGVDDGGVQWQRATAKADEEGPTVAKPKDYGDWVFEVRR